MEFQPLSDNILVRRAKPKEEKTDGGIIKPEVAVHVENRGTVVKVGPGKWDEDHEVRIPLDVSMGDQVMFTGYGAGTVDVNGEELIIMPAASVIGTFNKGK